MLFDIVYHRLCGFASKAYVPVLLPEKDMTMLWHLSGRKASIEYIPLVVADNGDSPENRSSHEHSGSSQA